MEELRSTGNFVSNLTSASGAGIVTIFDSAQINSNLGSLSADYHIGFEIAITALQGTINIPSFGYAPVPDIKPEDTQAEKNIKLQKFQEQFPKLGIALFSSVDGGAFIRQAVAVVQNRKNEYYLPLLMPYLTMSQTRLVGKNDKLGVQITNLGNGLLGSGDSILIQGSWRQNLTLIPKVVGVSKLIFTGAYTP